MSSSQTSGPASKTPVSVEVWPCAQDYTKYGLVGSFRCWEDKHFLFWLPLKLVVAASLFILGLVVHSPSAAVGKGKAELESLDAAARSCVNAAVLSKKLKGSTNVSWKSCKVTIPHS